MALKNGDRVQETFTTTGTGAVSLAGAVTGYQAFSGVMANADTCYYGATDGTNWEVGLGTYATSGNTLTRTTVLSSSNGNALVNWAAGTKSIWLDFPAASAAQIANPNAVQFAPTNPAGTTSGTLVQMGLAVGFKPASTGVLFIHISGTISNTSTGGASAKMTIGTGTAPANGVAVTGTPAGNETFYEPSIANTVIPFTCSGIVSGLTLGTQYWLDLALSRATAAGSASVSNLSISIFEIK